MVDCGVHYVDVMCQMTKSKPVRVSGKVAAQCGYCRPVVGWNFQEVRVQGSQVRVELNGTEILNTDQAKVTGFLSAKFSNAIPASGHLGFAGHGPGVAYRNLSIKEL